MVRHTTTEADDEPYAEDLAAEFADDLSRVNFDAVVSAVENEYAEAGHDPTTDSVLTPVGLAVKLCGDALAEADDTVVDDAWSCIDFDGSDEVSVEYDAFEHDDPHATPIALPRLAGLADAATDRKVRFRDGAGSVRVYVEVPERRDDDDEDEVDE